MIKWNAPAVQELDVKMTANGWNPAQEEFHNKKPLPFGKNEATTPDKES